MVETAAHLVDHVPAATPPLFRSTRSFWSPWWALVWKWSAPRSVWRDRQRGGSWEGEFWREDPNSSRLFFTATGRTFKKGEAYLGTYLIVLPFFAVGINYGVGTFGTSDHALTVGLGFGFSGDEFSNQPVAMIGGETRASRRIKLVTENYFLNFSYAFGRGR